MTDAIDDVLSDNEAATLNKVLMSAPSMITDAMLDAHIDALRKQRMMFVQKEASGKKPDDVPADLPPE